MFRSRQAVSNRSSSHDEGCEEVLEKCLPFQSSSHATGIFGSIVGRHGCDGGYEC